MPTNTATPIPVIEREDLRRDPEGEWRDESRRQHEERLRCEKDRVKLLADLNGKYGVAAYRTLARRSRNLTDAEYRLLDTLLDCSSGFKNCFPGRRRLLRRLGGAARKLRRLDALRLSLERKGWIERVELTEGDRVGPETSTDDGVLLEVNESGRFISASGYLFHVPASELLCGLIEGDDWDAPRGFGNRFWGQRQRKKYGGHRSHL